MTERVDLAVVGAGISGLAAAWEGLRQGARVVVLDAAGEPGGKLRTTPFGGVQLDEAADAFLARVPEGVELCAELGITGELVSPATGGAHVFLDGRLHRLPADQLLGVPTDLDALAASGLLSADGLARARRDLTAPDDRPPGGADESVGDLVRRRLGGEVLDRLVAPLVGSIYAGDCDRLSLQVAAAQLAAARDRDPHDPSLVRAAAALRADATRADRPVFFAPAGGMGRLVGALAERIGDDLRTAVEVTGLRRDRDGWRLDPSDLVADHVVVAAPAFAAAALVAPHAPAAAEVLAAIDHASVALVALAVARRDIDRDLDGSGFLVARSAGLLTTACSWVTSKWPHLATDPDLVLLRASVGHDGDDRAVTLADDALVTGVLADLDTTMGLRGAPVDVRVSRWSRSFPQPRPGHTARVTAAAAEIGRVPGLALAGAWVGGVGVPACIRHGRAAARTLLGT